MLPTIRTVAAILLTLASFAGVTAQDEADSPPDDPGVVQRLGRVPKPRLLLLKQVRGELNLTEAQKARAAEITADLQRSTREVVDRFGRAKRNARLKRLNDAAGLRLEGLLDEMQRQRLREIWIQVNGGLVLDDREIAMTLGLRRGQKRRLAEMRDNAARALTQATLSADGAERGDERWMEIRRDRDGRMLGVLTAEQRERLDQMQGQKVEIDVRPLFRPAGADE